MGKLRAFSMTEPERHEASTNEISRSISIEDTYPRDPRIIVDSVSRVCACLPMSVRAQASDLLHLACVHTVSLTRQQ